MDKRCLEVSKPGIYPQRTYISRYSQDTRYTYEERLQQCLAIDGYLTCIVDSFKIDKAVLCEKVIGAEHMVSMSGNDFSQTMDFWEGIAKTIGRSLQASVSQESAAIAENEQRPMTIAHNYFTTKDMVLDYFKEHHKVLILDDLHYAPTDIQYHIVCQLKDAIRQGLKAVIILPAGRFDDIIRLNPDLIGRISIIEIESLTMEELK